MAGKVKLKRLKSSVDKSPWVFSLLLSTDAVGVLAMIETGT